MATQFTLEDLQNEPDNLFRLKERYKTVVVEDPMVPGRYFVEAVVEHTGMTAFRGSIDQFNEMFEDSGIA